MTSRQTSASFHSITSAAMPTVTAAKTFCTIDDAVDGHHVVDAADVVGDARLQLAGPGAGEEPQRHPLQVRVHADPQVVHDPLADRGWPARCRRRRARPRRRRATSMPPASQLTSDGAALGQRAVDDLAQQERRGHVGQRLRGRDADQREHLPAVRAEQPGDAAQRDACRPARPAVPPSRGRPSCFDHRDVGLELGQSQHRARPPARASVASSGASTRAIARASHRSRGAISSRRAPPVRPGSTASSDCRPSAGIRHPPHVARRLERGEGAGERLRQHAQLVGDLAGRDRAVGDDAAEHGRLVQAERPGRVRPGLGRPGPSPPAGSMPRVSRCLRVVRMR